MRSIALILCTFLLFNLLGCSNKSEERIGTTEPSTEAVFERAFECSLIVDSVPVKSAAYLLNQEGIGLIPFTKAMEYLGAKVESENENLILFRYNEETYFLDLENKRLTNENINIGNNPSNLIMKPPGSTNKSYFELYNGDCYIDTDSIAIFMEYIIGKKISIDWQKNSITIA